MDDEIAKSSGTPEAKETDNTKSDEGEKVSGRTDENNSEGAKPGKDGSGQAENTHFSGQTTDPKPVRRGDNRGETSPRRPDKLKVGATKSDKRSSGRNDKQSNKVEQPVRHSFYFQRRRQTKEAK